MGRSHHRGRDLHRPYRGTAAGRFASFHFRVTHPSCARPSRTREALGDAERRSPGAVVGLVPLWPFLRPARFPPTIDRWWRDSIAHPATPHLDESPSWPVASADGFPSRRSTWFVSYARAFRRSGGSWRTCALIAPGSPPSRREPQAPIVAGISLPDGFVAFNRWSGGPRCPSAGRACNDPSLIDRPSRGRFSDIRLTSRHLAAWGRDVPL